MNALQWVLILLLIAAVIMLMRDVRGLKKVLDQVTNDPPVKGPPEISDKEYSRMQVEEHERKFHRGAR